MRYLALIAGLALAASPSLTQATSLKPFEDKEIGLFGLKNQKGDVVVKPQYQVIVLEDHLIVAVKNNHFYRLDRDGKPKFEAVFYDNGADYYEQGLARFIEKSKVGFHDKKGNIVIKPTYDWASPFTDGKAFVCLGCWATFEKLPRYTPAASSSTGPMLGDEHLTVTGGKWGAINLKGEVVLPLESKSWEEARQKLAK